MGAAALVVTATFLASVVEAVEALTIVLAVGVTQNWRTALLGLLGGLVALAAVVIGCGPALVRIVPLDSLRVFIGVLLLIFGLQWMRKAILRASGLKAVHDEAAIFEKEVAQLQREGAAGATGPQDAIDWTGFVVSFKGVFLEGLEVAFIVLTFGANREGAFGWSALGAVLAVAVVAIMGVAVHRPLARVPENSIKFAVATMLISFGTFWGGEGIGVRWALSDGMIPVLIACYAAVAFVLVAVLKRRAAAPLAAAREARA